MKKDTKSLETAMSDMIPETYSGAAGKEEVDSSYKLYINAMDALNTINANIANKQGQVDDLKAWIDSNSAQSSVPNPAYQSVLDQIHQLQYQIDSNEYPTCSVAGMHGKGNYGDQACKSGVHNAAYVADLKTKWDLLNSQMTSLKSILASTPQTITSGNSDYAQKYSDYKVLVNQLAKLKANQATQQQQTAIYQSNYQAAQQNYDAAVANENAIDQQAKQNLADTQQQAAQDFYNAQINAAENGQTYVDPSQQQAAPTPAPTPLPAMKAGFMSKITKTQKIAGVVVLVVLVAGGIYGHKKGWFKKAHK